jgi:uncharacterized membrane protein YeiB
VSEKDRRGAFKREKAVMQEHQSGFWEAVVRMVMVVLAWSASIKLADVQAVVAILSGLGVLIYTGMQAYLLWRDRIRGGPGMPPSDKP